MKTTLTPDDIGFILECLRYNRTAYEERCQSHTETIPDFREKHMKHTIQQMDEVNIKLHELREEIKLPLRIDLLEEAMRDIKKILKHFEEDTEGFLKIKKLQNVKLSSAGKMRFYKEKKEETVANLCFIH